LKFNYHQVEILTAISRIRKKKKEKQRNVKEMIHTEGKKYINLQNRQRN
jgi:hypothetical protein